MFDSEDWSILNKYKWNVNSQRYVWSHRRNKPPLLMHRLLLGIDGNDQLLGDHVNHQPNDNRKSNLRVATPGDNARNRTPSGRTKYLGVSYQTCRYKSIKTGKIFIYQYLKAKIRVNNKLIHLGTFIYEEDAALAYNDAAKKYFGEFANLNIVK